MLMSEKILITALLLGVVGNIVIWAGLGPVPRIVISLVGSIVCGGYGGLRAGKCRGCPGFGVKNLWRITCVLLLSGMLIGDIFRNGNLNWDVTFAIIAGIGVDVFSLGVTSNECS